MPQKSVKKSKKNRKIWPKMAFLAKKSQQIEILWVKKNLTRKCFFVHFLIIFKKKCYKNRTNRTNGLQDIAISKSSDLIGLDRFSQKKAKNRDFPGKRMVRYVLQPYQARFGTNCSQK